LGIIKERLEQKLRDAFSPSICIIKDQSHLHAGHAGADPAGETHFRLEIVSDAFAGKSRLEAHRMIYAVIQEEMEERVHALVIRAREG
jgi:BolA family transcriptional regulator, general stress-responsive regulator